MPTLLDYRRRIRSVKSTQQITRAMKFVAAAKLRRAQEGVFAARPYAREILRVLRSAAARMESTAHPLLERRPEERILVIVLTGDRSLAGAFNSNVIRRAIDFPARERFEKDAGDRRRQKGPRHAAQARLDVRRRVIERLEQSGILESQGNCRQDRRALCGARGRRRLRRLQRIQERDGAEPAHGETAADRPVGARIGTPRSRSRCHGGSGRGAAARSGGERKVARRLHLRGAASTKFSVASCRAISNRKYSASCSNRPRRSTPRA